MAFPAYACSPAIGSDIKAKDGARAFCPTNASRIGIEQFSINREVLPVIGGDLTTWRYIAQHKKLQM